MKKAISLLFILITLSCQAQQLSFKQLLQLSSCKEFTQNNIFLNSLNYQLKDSIVKKKLTQYVWHKGKANDVSNDSLKTATWMQIKTMFTLITATTGTSVENEALEFVNELAAEGFSFESMSATDKTTTTKFKNTKINNIQVEQTSNMQTNGGVTSIYWYTFKIIHIIE